MLFFQKLYNKSPTALTFMDYVHCMQIKVFPDRNDILVARMNIENGYLTVIDLASNKAKVNIVEEFKGFQDFHPLINNRLLFESDKHSKLMVFDLNDKKSYDIFIDRPESANAYLKSIVISASKVACYWPHTEESSVVKIYDINSGKLFSKIFSNIPVQKILCYGEDQLLCCCQDGSLFVWDVTKEQMISELACDSLEELQGVLSFEPAALFNKKYVFYKLKYTDTRKYHQPMIRNIESGIVSFIGKDCWREIFGYGFEEETFLFEINHQKSQHDFIGIILQPLCIELEQRALKIYKIEDLINTGNNKIDPVFELNMPLNIDSSVSTSHHITKLNNGCLVVLNRDGILRTLHPESFSLENKNNGLPDCDIRFSA